MSACHDPRERERVGVARIGVDVARRDVEPRQLCPRRERRRGQIARSDATDRLVGFHQAYAGFDLLHETLHAPTIEPECPARKRSIIDPKSTE